jgi:hypothetical protein
MTSNQQQNNNDLASRRNRVGTELRLLSESRNNVLQRFDELRSVGREYNAGNLYTKNHLLSYIFSSQLTEIQRQLLISYFPSYHSLNCKILAVLVGLISLPLTDATQQRSPIETWAGRLSKFKGLLVNHNNSWNDFAYNYNHYVGITNPEARDRNRPVGNPPHPLQAEYHSVYLDGWNFVREFNRNDGGDDRAALAQIEGVLTMRLNEAQVRQRELFQHQAVQRRVAQNTPATAEQQSDVWGKIAGAPDPDDLPDCYLCLETILPSKPIIKPFNCSHPICLDCAKTHLQVDRWGRFPQAVNKCGVCRENTSGYNRAHLTLTLNTFAEFY